VCARWLSKAQELVGFWTDEVELSSDKAVGIVWSERVDRAVTRAVAANRTQTVNGSVTACP